MAEDNAGKVLANALPPDTLSQEVFILREHHAAQPCRPIQQHRVPHVAVTVVLYRQDVHPLDPDGVGYCALNLLVNVQP